jgi:hypothetical protein
MGFNGYLMGFNGDLMGFNGDLMGFHGAYNKNLTKMFKPKLFGFRSLDPGTGRRETTQRGFQFMII